MASFLISNISYGFVGDAAGSRISGALRVRDGLIAEIGDLEPAPGERVIDASACVVTPGLVNTHHHLFQSVLKAVPDGLNHGLDTWLQKVPYAFWPYIDEETLRIAATAGMAELVLTGTTTVADHHYAFSDRYDYDPSAVLFEVAEEFGVRFVLARGGGTKGSDYFDDPAMPPPMAEPLDRYLAGVEAAANRWHDSGPLAMTRVAAAPTTPTFNVEAHELRDIAAAARAKGLRLHSHLSENTTYVAYTIETYGKRPVHWLAEQGWTGPDVWYAHLVEIDDSEVAHLAETGTAMAHCAQANARLGFGIAPADLLHHSGGIVSLGVDGAGANEAANMGAALYETFNIHRATKGAAATTPETVLHWACQGGARCLGYEQTGLLKPGMAADISLFELSHPRHMGLHDPAVAPIVTGAAPVRASFVGGRQIVENGRITWLDLETLGDNARRVTERLIQKRQQTLAS